MHLYIEESAFSLRKGFNRFTLLHRLRLGASARHKGQRQQARPLQPELRMELAEPACLDQRLAVHGQLHLRCGRTAGGKIHPGQRDPLLQQDVEPPHRRRKRVPGWPQHQEHLPGRDTNCNETCGGW